MDFIRLAIARKVNARHGLEMTTTYADLGVETFIFDVLQALAFVICVVYLRAASQAFRQTGMLAFADASAMCAVLLVIGVPLSLLLAAVICDRMLTEEEQAEREEGEPTE